MGTVKKLRFLCLHSFRTSALIFWKQMERALWMDKFAEQLDMVSADTLMSQLVADHRKAIYNMVTL
jgi:hypothetical protein